MARHKGLYKRGNIWWICYKGLDGRIIRKSSESSKYSDAEYMRSTDVKAVKEGKEPAKKIGNYTFNDLADQYLAWVTGRQASATVKGYIIGRLKEKYGTLPLRKFNTALVEQIQTELMNKGLNPSNTNGLKNAANNKVMNTLKAMFSKAVEWEMIEEDHLKKIRKVKLFKETGRIRYLSIPEAQALISVCEPHLQPVVITAIHTGMRRGEILSLKWEQVDLINGHILLDKTKNGERREVPINKTLAETLQRIPRSFTGERDNRQLVPYVFHDPKTLKPYDDVKRSFHTALKRAGITDFHFHDCRHHFASHMIMSGKVDLPTLSKLLGHKNVKQTMKYAHLAPTHIKKAAFVMDEIMQEGLSQELTTQLLHNEQEKELVHVN
jgi:integrase